MGNMKTFINLVFFSSSSHSLHPLEGYWNFLRSFILFLRLTNVLQISSLSTLSFINVWIVLSSKY